MALALIAGTKPQLIQILNANRLAYAAVVGTSAAARNAAYPYDQEVTDALLKADGHVVTEGYFQTRFPLRSRFMVESANLANGANLPEFAGKIGKVEYSIDGSDWNPSSEVLSREDAAGAAASGSYVTAAAGGSSPFAGLHYIDESEGAIYHGSPYCRINYPQYTRTTVLQALEQHEPAIIAWALVFLYKDRSNAAFEHYTALANSLLQAVRNGSMDLDPVQPIGGNS